VEADNAMGYGWGSPWLKGDVRPVLLNQQALASEHKEEVGQASMQVEGDTGLNPSAQPTSTPEYVPVEEATPIQSIEIVHSVSPSEHTPGDEHGTVEGAIPMRGAEDVLPILPDHCAIESEHGSMNNGLSSQPNSYIDRVLG